MKQGNIILVLDEQYPHVSISTCTLRSTFSSSVFVVQSALTARPRVLALCLPCSWRWSACESNSSPQKPPALPMLFSSRRLSSQLRAAAQQRAGRSARSPLPSTSSARCWPARWSTCTRLSRTTTPPATQIIAANFSGKGVFITNSVTRD